MDKLLFILCFLVLAATPAGASDLGGKGIDTTQRRPGLRVPDEDRGTLRIPLGKQRDENASAGTSAPERRRGTDLGYEAEKEEEAFQKKQRTAPLKAK